MAEEKFTFVESLLVLPVAAVVFIGAVFILLPFGFLLSWVRMILWEWFAVPLLHLPALSFWQIYALGLIPSTFIHTIAQPKDAPKPSLGDSMKGYYMEALEWVILLGVGYVLHIWMHV